MAVKVTKINNVDELNKKVTADLFSDTKAEMNTIQVEDIIGFPKGYELDFGSSVFTSSGQLAFTKSDGSWNWGE